MAAPIEIRPRTPLTSRRILIADANRSRFMELTKALQDANIEVLHISERPQVVPTAVAFQPDLVLMNLFLGAANTLSLIRELKGALDRQGTKILILTAHYSKDNIKECIRNGAADFILEPFDSRLVLQRVRYQLQDREAYSPEELRAEPTQVLAGFQLVYDCLRILTEIKETHVGLHECLKRVSDLSKSTRVNIVMGDLETNSGFILASSDDPKLDNLSIDLEKYPEVREVLLNGSIVYVKDITQNPLTKDIKDNVKSIKINSIIVFPIRHRQETVATLNIRLAGEGMEISDKHLKTFYMVALSLSSKVAARKLLKKMQPTAT